MKQVTLIAAVIVLVASCSNEAEKPDPLPETSEQKVDPRPIPDPYPAY